MHQELQDEAKNLCFMLSGVKPQLDCFCLIAWFFAHQAGRQSKTNQEPKHGLACLFVVMLCFQHEANYLCSMRLFSERRVNCLCRIWL